MPQHSDEAHTTVREIPATPPKPRVLNMVVGASAPRWNHTAGPPSSDVHGVELTSHQLEPGKLPVLLSNYALRFRLTGR